MGCTIYTVAYRVSHGERRFKIATYFFIMTSVALGSTVFFNFFVFCFIIKCCLWSERFTNKRRVLAVKTYDSGKDIFSDGPHIHLEWIREQMEFLRKNLKASGKNDCLFICLYFGLKAL